MQIKKKVKGRSSREVATPKASRNHKETSKNTQLQVSKATDLITSFVRKQKSGLESRFQVDDGASIECVEQNTEQGDTKGFKDESDPQVTGTAAEDTDGDSRGVPSVESATYSSNLGYSQEHVSTEVEVEYEELDDFDPYFFIKNLPDLSTFVPSYRPVLLPRQTRSRPSITLVLDLDETLVHSMLEPCQNADFTFQVNFNQEKDTVYVRCRPYLRHFMERVSALFEVVTTLKMSSRKEEEKNEKIIRGLLKLPPNRRCINCNSLGPQYVCTTFWTFVCTTCSGIHREFTHRVKSVSMAKFTSQEVEALQNGGNQRTIEKYLRDWDPQRQRLKDNSNAEKIRQFIKDVYVDKKYATPRSSEKPPRDLQTLRSREEEIPRASSYHSFSQSPPYDYQYEERRYGKQAPALTRKPGSDKGLYEGKNFSFLSPTHSSDHIYEDRLANEGSNPRMSNYSVSSEGDHFKTDTQSPNCQKDMRNPFSQSSEDAMQVLRSQRTSFGSFGSLDSMSPKSESFGTMEVGSEPEQLVNAHRSLHSVGNPSVSQNSDGVDLFNAPIAQQNNTSVFLGNTNYQHPNSTIPTFDLFQPSLSLTHQTLQNSQTSSLDLLPQQLPAATLSEKLPGVQNTVNGGWATFDTQNVEYAVNNGASLMPSVGNSKTSILPSSNGIAGSDVNPLFMASWSPFEEFATDNSPSSTGFWNELSGSVQSGLHIVNSEWPSLTNASGGGGSSSVSATLNESLQIVEDTSKAMDTSSWDAFKDLTSQLNSQSGPTSNEHVETRQPSEAYYHVDYREKEDFTVEVAHTAGVNLSMSSHVSKTLGSFPMPVMEVAHKSGSDLKPSNPFDQPYDSDIEPSNPIQFWDMGSLDAALPNRENLTGFVDDETQPWFTSGLGTPYVPSEPQGALGFMASQAGSTVIANMHAEGTVAHVGGNPFA